MRSFLILFLIVYSRISFAQPARAYELVIDEIMADPSPSVGLPPAEFIELKNRSGRTMNLAGWKLTTSSVSSGAFPNYSLPADSFLILCSNSNASLFAGFGKTLGIPAFPALDNDGTTLTLMSKEGANIHALAYTSSWYRNEIKKEGGWSLEMIDTNNPCNGMNNWKASEQAGGGTPGRKNSIDAVNPDQTPPRLLRSYSMDSLVLVAVFDEPLDSSSGALTKNYSLDNAVSVIAAVPLPGLFNRVLLKLSDVLRIKTVYMLTVNAVADCSGNVVGQYHQAKAGVAEEALTNDIIINEILFNPRPNAFDYVELYNRSGRILDAGKIYLANRTPTGSIGNPKKISETPFYIFPGDYVVVTEDVFSLQREYLVQSPEHVLNLPALPSFPDDKGAVLVINAQGDLVDELNYSHSWHFALISDEEGIALERIDPAASPGDPANWHSAASTAGYGTPGYKNSQYRPRDDARSTVEIRPLMFSPDNDGHDDFMSIIYQVEEPGYLANIKIFDAVGRQVRYFVKNGLMGSKGSWNWDGLDENHLKLPAGNYIVCTELFNLKGKKKQFKNVVVLAGN